jgi:hypothetical protein
LKEICFVAVKEDARDTTSAARVKRGGKAVARINCNAHGKVPTSRRIMVVEHHGRSKFSQGAPSAFYFGLLVVVVGGNECVEKAQ